MPKEYNAEHLKAKVRNLSGGDNNKAKMLIRNFIPEIMVEGYVGFLFRDKSGMPEVAMNVNDIPRNRGVEAMKAASRIAEEYGIADMTLDEINAEIAEARK